MSGAESVVSRNIEAGNRSVPAFCCCIKSMCTYPFIGIRNTLRCTLINSTFPIMLTDFITPTSNEN